MVWQLIMHPLDLRNRRVWDSYGDQGELMAAGVVHPERRVANCVHPLYRPWKKVLLLENCVTSFSSYTRRPTSG
jgi:hypothetical protein